MKIRIVKAGDSEYWYADKVGAVFETTGRTQESNISVRYNGEDFIYYVGLDDCEEVVEHNSQLYRKVDRPVREGDTVLITKAAGTFGKYTNGDVIEVERKNNFGIFSSVVATKGDRNDEGYISNGEFTVIEPIEQPVQLSAPTYAEVSELLHEAKADFNEGVDELTGKYDNALRNLSDDNVTHNGKQYRKVKRNAVVGELVVVTDAVSAYDYKNGDVFEAKVQDTDGIEIVDNIGDDNALYDSEYHVLELVEQSGQSETLTERDLLANLAQEVAELKRQLTNAQTDIADLEDRVDESEKDVEEVIGRMNDLGDAMTPKNSTKVVIKGVTRNAHRTVFHAIVSNDKVSINGMVTLKNPDNSVSLEDAVEIVKEALRNG